MKKTVFMIHGMASGQWAWDNYRRVLETAGYTCIAVTLPYHNTDPSAAADPKLGTASLLDYAAAVEQQIRALPEKPIIIGHSMGGLIAQMLASRDLAQAAILITPAPPAGILALTPSVLKTFAPIIGRWNFWKKSFRFPQHTAQYAILNRLSPAQQAAEYASFVPESGRAAFEIGYWIIDRKHATRVNAKKVTCPILVIGATEDRITPVSVVKQVAKKYSTATYRQYDQHAHMIMIEDGWRSVADDVVAWLAQHA